MMIVTRMPLVRIILAAMLCVVTADWGLGVTQIWG